MTPPRLCFVAPVGNKWFNELTCSKATAFGSLLPPLPHSTSTYMLRICLCTTKWIDNGKTVLYIVGYTHDKLQARKEALSCLSRIRWNQPASLSSALAACCFLMLVSLPVCRHGSPLLDVHLLRLTSFALFV